MPEAQRTQSIESMTLIIFLTEINVKKFSYKRYFSIRGYTRCKGWGVFNFHRPGWEWFWLFVALFGSQTICQDVPLTIPSQQATHVLTSAHLFEFRKIQCENITVNINQNWSIYRFFGEFVLLTCFLERHSLFPYIIIFISNFSIYVYFFNSHFWIFIFLYFHFCITYTTIFLYFYISIFLVLHILILLYLCIFFLIFMFLCFYICFYISINQYMSMFLQSFISIFPKFFFIFYILIFSIPIFFYISIFLYREKASECKKKVVRAQESFIWGGDQTPEAALTTSRLCVFSSPPSSPWECRFNISS